MVHAPCGIDFWGNIEDEVSGADGPSALAKQGLQPTGNGNWEANYATGEPVHGAPGEGKFGNLRSGALEDSNIDITGELVAMMSAQRAYQANAQTIKTQDQVLSTMLNMR
mgnify:CR=1 FL=1